MDARVQDRAKCTWRGAGRSSSRRWLEFLSPKTQLLISNTSKKTNDPITISAQEACFDFARTMFLRPELLCGSDSVLQILVWSQNKYHSCEIETGFLCLDGALVVRFSCSCDKQLGFGTRKIHANVDYCHVRRRAECTYFAGPGTQASKPTLRLRSDSSLATKGRAEAFHVVLFFNKASEPSTMSS